jgi:hypothetical protein
MRDAWRRFLGHRLAVLGLGVIAILVVLAVGARVFSPHDPLRQDLPRALAGPSADFPLGTDEFGRCILSRILYGARLSLLVGVIATGIGASAGILSGLLAGYFPRVESVVMRTMDASPAARPLLDAGRDGHPARREFLVGRREGDAETAQNRGDQCDKHRASVCCGHRLRISPRIGRSAACEGRATRAPASAGARESARP